MATKTLTGAAQLCPDGLEECRHQCGSEFCFRLNAAKCEYPVLAVPETAFDKARSRDFGFETVVKTWCRHCGWEDEFTFYVDAEEAYQRHWDSYHEGGRRMGRP